MDYHKIVDLISRYGLPVTIPGDLDRLAIKAYLKTDKKALGGRVFYILPAGIGNTRITDDISAEELDSVLSEGKS